MGIQRQNHDSPPAPGTALRLPVATIALQSKSKKKKCCKSYKKGKRCKDCPKR
jgi:hypothetical protein